MNYIILNKICSFLTNFEKLLSSSKQFTVKRFRNIRWKNRIYFKDNRIKITYNRGEGRIALIIYIEKWFKNKKKHRDCIDPKTGFIFLSYIEGDRKKYWYKDGNIHRDEICSKTGMCLPAFIFLKRKYWLKRVETS